MREPEWLQLFEILILFSGALWDIYSHRIPNLLIVYGTAAGLMLQYIARGVTGLVIGTACAVLVVLVSSPLFILKVLGGGDIKLLAVLCICTDPKDILKTLFAVFAAGAIYSLIKLLAYGNLTARVKYLFQYAANTVRTGSFAEYELADKKDQLTIPMAVPIFLGGVIMMGGH